MSNKRRTMIAATIAAIGVAAAGSPVAAADSGDPCPPSPSICGLVEGATGYRSDPVSAAMIVVVHGDFAAAELYVAGATGYPPSWNG